jgi:hypothetical protein
MVMYMKRLNAPTEKDAALEEVKPKRDLMRAEVINLIYLDGRARSTDPDDGHSSGDNRLAVRYSRVYACRVSVCTDRIAMCLRGLIQSHMLEGKVSREPAHRPHAPRTCVNGIE